jgi:hypothetical protein
MKAGIGNIGMAPGFQSLVDQKLIIRIIRHNESLLFQSDSKYGLHETRMPQTDIRTAI